MRAKKRRKLPSKLFNATLDIEIKITRLDQKIKTLTNASALPSAHEIEWVNKEIGEIKQMGEALRNMAQKSIPRIGEEEAVRSLHRMKTVMQTLFYSVAKLDKRHGIKIEKELES